MSIIRSTILTILIVAAISVSAEDLPRVTLAVQDQPAVEVVAALQQQVPAVQLAAAAGVKSNLTLDLKDVTLQEACAAIAKELKGSCVRSYIIERVGPGDKPYTAEELIDYLTAASQEWQARLTPEQRRIWQDRIAATVRQRLQPRAEGLTVQEQADRMFAYEDPLRRLATNPLADKLTVTVPEAPVQQAFDAIMLQSGHMVLLEDGLAGVCALQEQDQEVGAVVDKVAAALQAKARMFYLISEPTKLAGDEVARREERAFTGMWQQFWGMPKEERAQAVQGALKTLEAVPPERLSEIRSAPITGRMFTRFLEVQPQLSPEQRQEIRPLIQAVTKIMAR